MVRSSAGAIEAIDYALGIVCNVDGAARIAAEGGGDDWPVTESVDLGVLRILGREVQRPDAPAQKISEDVFSAQLRHGIGEREVSSRDRASLFPPVLVDGIGEA